MMYVLPAKFRTDLLAALRSGKYKQGDTCLRSTEDEFCVHGVALDLLGMNWGKKKRGSYNPNYVEREKLTDSVYFWPVMMAMFDARVISKPFLNVADWIEANTQVGKLPRKI